MALTRDSTGVVIADDTDVAWTYEPTSAWERHGVVEEYRGTTHGTWIATSTATFRFNGEHHPCLNFPIAIADPSPSRYRRRDLRDFGHIHRIKIRRRRLAASHL